MTDIKTIHDFSREIDCTYKEELYSVRDNGAVLKYSQVGKRPNSSINQWTFGRPNEKTGYLEIASARIHRIVATAFHGIPPTKEHVVDHIDTNKHNNRPENLRWVTRLENVLLNPITSKRIAIVCGSVEAFLSNPSKFRDKFQEPNYSWMCKVSRQEAQISLERMLEWAKSDKLPSGGSLYKWIFNRTNMQNQHIEIIPDVPKIIMSKTLNAGQRNWKTPSEFPCCPKENTEEPISDYAKNLKGGSIFCINEFYSSLVLNSTISDDNQSIFALTESTKGENALKPFALTEITYENGLFVHMNYQSYFSKKGAEKQYCLAQGLKWKGGDSVDDYC